METKLKLFNLLKLRLLDEDTSGHDLDLGAQPTFKGKALGTRLRSKVFAFIPAITFTIF